MKNRTKTCVLTLDYELFFKDSGTAEASILHPTSLLIETLEKINGKATFFVDALYLLKLKDGGELHKNTYTTIEKQLIEIVTKGHKIELHLHPHWLDAYWDAVNNTWIFSSYKHYKLNSLNSTQISEIFDSTVSLLNEIGAKAIKNYKVSAFRAGGWCIEPFEILVSNFLKHNIKIDSSVIPGYSLTGEIHSLDYTAIHSKNMYRFSESVKIPVNDGLFIELPMSTYSINIIEKIFIYIQRQLNRFNSKIFGDGVGIPIQVKKSNFYKFLELIKNFKKTEFFSIDGYNSSRVFCTKVMGSKDDIVVIVGHPKTLTFSSFSVLEQLAQKGNSFVTIDNMLK